MSHNLSFQRYMVRKILSENGYSFTDEEIDSLIEANFLQNVRKYTAPAALALAGMSAAASPQSASAEPSLSKPSVGVSRSSGGVERSTIDKFWHKVGNTYIPMKGNGILIKHHTSISFDELKDDKNDLSFIKTADPFQTISVEGHGLNLEEAIKDALRFLAREGVESKLGAETIVKNDELTKDAVWTQGEAIIGKFEILDIKENNGMFTVKLRGEIQSRKGQSAMGSERFRELNPKTSKFDTRGVRFNF